MTPSFEKFDAHEFRHRITTYDFRRQIDAVHLHHTLVPDHATFAGEKSILAMWRYHTQVKRWSDIAQHVTVDPSGGLWSGRDWNRAPASATHQNGTFARGPFMVEMVGNFDQGRDRLEGAQLDATVAVVAAVQDRFGLTTDSLRFHNEFSSKTCPGQTVTKDQLLALVGALRGATAAAGSQGGSTSGAGASEPEEIGCGENGEATPPATGEGAPIRRAVCVGINDYINERPLSGCVADAHAWARLLAAAGFEVQLVLNQEATRDGILSALRALVADAACGSSIVFQFAGHGILLPDEDGDELGRADPTPFDDESLVPYDSDRGAYLTDDDLAEVFGALRSGVAATLLIDACYSGGIRHLGAGPVAAPIGAVARVVRATDQRIGAHRAFRSTLRNGRAEYPMATSPAVAFSACQSFELALEENGRGVFSRVATDVLASRPDTTNEQFVRSVIEAMGSPRRQTPVLDCPPAALGARIFEPFET